MTTSSRTTGRRHLTDVASSVTLVLGLVLGLVVLTPGVADAAVGTNLDQCANDSNNDDVRNDCAWQHGNLNKNNSVYAEGDSVAFRAQLTGLTVGSQYTLPINYDILNSGFVAYDQLTSWNRTESGNPASGSPTDTEVIPHDPHAASHGIPRATPAEAAIWGGTYDAIAYTSPGGLLPTAANASTTSEVLFTFTATAESATLAWGGHIALRQDWNPLGYTTAPQATSGSPYHMRFGDELGEKPTGSDTFTYSSIGNQDRSLKADAVILPGSVRIVKVDAQDNLLSGFSFEVYDNSGLSGDPVFACTTDTAGVCLSGDLEPGTYYVVEVDGPDGYTLDTAPRTVTIDENGTAEVTYVNARVDYTIDVAPPGRNAVGSDHLFTVTLTGGGSALAGATVALSWSGDGSITAVNGTATDTTSTTCTTDAAGQCTVTVSSSSPGDGILTATFDTPYQHGTGDGGTSTDGALVDTISDTATKTWVGYVASIERTATNLISVGDGTAGVHVFTATVKEDDGSTLTAAAGVEVTVTWTGAPAGATITPSSLTCTTDTSGQCTFTVDSPTSGAGTITITALDGTILGLDDTTTTDDESLTYDAGVPGSEPIAEDGKSLTATKTWREYRALIDGDATNPVDQPHTFNVQVQYSEDDGTTWTDAAIAGMTVAWETGTGDVGSDDLAASTCDDGTAADGTCTIVVTSSVAGTRTVTLLSVTGDLLPDDIPDDPSLTFSFTDTQYDATADPAELREATKTWLDFGASIEADGHNLIDTATVDGSHTFTVTVFRDPPPGETGTDVPDGTKVATLIEWDLDGTWTDITTTDQEPAGLVVSNGCADPGTEASQCEIIVNSGTPGSVRVTVTGLENYDFGDGPTSFTFSTADQDDATKTWYAYRATIAADGVNLVGVDHPFTVTAEQTSGNGDWEPVPSGTTITVSESGDGELKNGIDTCTTTDATGTCTVTVTSTEPGLSTVTVESVSAEDVDGDPTPTATVANGTLTVAPEGSLTADKEWIEYFADIEASATNLTGQSHTFYVTVTQEDAGGLGPVPAGTLVTISDDSTSITPTGTCTTTGTGDDPRTDGVTETNVCTVVVDSSVVDRVTVTVTGVQALDVDGDPTPTAIVANQALSTAPGGSRSATKTWVEVLVDVEADETNIVGEPHTFTVDIDVVTPDGTVPAPDDTVVAFSSTGVGDVVLDDEVPGVTGSTCDEPVDGGSCTIVVVSDAPGTRSVEVDSVAFTLGGSSHLVDWDDGDVVGEADGSDLTATKTWRAYRVGIAADGFNAVGDDHPFTVTIEQTDDADPTEENWGPVLDGTTATVTITNGPGSITSNDCDAPDGTSGGTGTCSVTINSAVAGTTTVTVSEISVAHPDTQASTTVDVTNDRATKTWIAFRALISDDSVNITGDDHTFHVDVEYTTDGDTWSQVPDGSAVGVSDDRADPGSAGGIDSHTCGSTVASAGDTDTPAHVCTVTVSSTTSGQLKVTVDGVSTADITANGITTTFDVDFTGTVGVVQGLDPDAVSATKTWASYTLSLGPVDAVNLLSGETDDPERFHTITATLSSDDAVNAPVGGQVIEVTISGSTGAISSVEGGVPAGDGLSATCVTDTDGTCDVVIFSSVPGTAELDASYEATVGDSDPVTVVADTDLETEGIQGATKTWTTYRVTVTPSQAVNLVGNPHLFTVTVEQSSPAGDCDADWCPVQGAAPTIDVAGTGLTVDDSDCADGTAADGTCVVEVTSGTVQAVTLTATYEASVGQVTAAFSDSGDKDWIDYGLVVTPDTAENLVDTDHVFTVTITTTFPGETGAVTLPVQDAVPAILLSGTGSITANDCEDGTNAAGQCTVTITSSAAGSSTLTATYLGTAADDAEVRPFADSGDKLWVDYLLVLGDDAVNAVGDEHTFTATLSVDTGGGFGPASGETLTFTVDGVGAVTGGDTGDDLSCTTDAAGQCDLVINSDEPGTTDVGVSHDAVVGATSRTFEDGAVKQWMDIALVKTAVVGDGIGDGDLVADPGGGPPVLSFTSDDGPKTAVFEYTITNTGPVTLVDVELTDDRLGTVIDASDGITLAPGESTTVRASEQFTFDDAAATLGALVTNVAVVTADDGAGNEVSDTDDAVIQLSAQLPQVIEREPEPEPEPVVLGVEVVRPPPAPAPLPTTGADAEQLLLVSLLLMVLGGVLLAGNRQRPAPATDLGRLGMSAARTVGTPNGRSPRGAWTVPRHRGLPRRGGAGPREPPAWRARGLPRYRDGPALP